VKAAALALLAAGCGTWGVEVVEREVVASHPADGIAAVTAELSVEGEVTASGGGEGAIGATADLVAWIEPGGSAALLDRVRIAMVPRGSTLAIEPDTKGAATEQIVLEDLDIVLPAAIDLDLAVSHGDVSVQNLDGHVYIAAPTSAVSLERTGRVDVSAREVTAQLSGGGAIETTGGGSVTVTVLGDAFDQLLVTTETGPVTIHLPADRGWDIELATSGEATATVNLGGLSCGGAGAEPCDAVRFGEGGPLIRVESGGGAIAVDDVR
jgi:hypothetical protein